MAKSYDEESSEVTVVPSALAGLLPQVARKRWQPMTGFWKTSQVQFSDHVAGDRNRHVRFLQQTIVGHVALDPSVSLHLYVVPVRARYFRPVSGLRTDHHIVEVHIHMSGRAWPLYLEWIRHLPYKTPHTTREDWCCFSFSNTLMHLLSQLRPTA